MLDYPPGYEIDGNTITPGGISAVMAVTRPRGADCGAVCGVVCGAVRGAGWIGVRERVPGAAARGGALAPRRGRRSGARSGLRSGRTSEQSGLPLKGGGAGLRTGPVQGYVAVRSGVGVASWRPGWPQRCGRRAGGRDAKGREWSFSPGDGGVGPPGHGTTCRGRLEPDARSNDRSAVRRNGSPSVASARSGRQPVCTRPPSRPDSGSRARRLSRARPQSPQPAARPPPQPRRPKPPAAAAARPRS